MKELRALSDPSVVASGIVVRPLGDSGDELYEWEVTSHFGIISADDDNCREQKEEKKTHKKTQ